MIKLFVYGSLLNENVRKRVIGRDVLARHTVLHNHAKTPLSFNPRYPTLVEVKDNVVQGMVLEVTADEMDKIDRYETKMYKKKYFLDDWVTYVENDE